ncbi:MAG TPA: RNase adapter RapZ [Alphaproteobacteria bacterium]|nr:RNase adapter RapZ [Alphaproteobacteria bacterium]
MLTPSMSNENPVTKKRIVLVTGMSGAGLSTALKAFEDLGYEAVDNLRLNLIPALVEDRTSGRRALAVAIDTRNANFSVDEFLRVAAQLAETPGLDARLLFLECADEALERRFTETRRRHPLALDRPVTDGIKREREMLWKLRDAAGHVIDTSLLSLHDLRRQIAGHYRIEGDPGLTLFVTSFSYRHGVPREADLVFDARFLANPHWQPKLRGLSGQDEVVAAYVKHDPGYADFMAHLAGLLLPLLPRYREEGKSYLTIAVGCTGGRHRSVAVAEELATILAAHGYVTGIGHRDLDRGASKA